MPECKQCEGAGEVIVMPDGDRVPFYRGDPNKGQKLLCDRCDGWGRVDEDRPNPGYKELIACNIPADAKHRDFDPFPGSDKAVRLGCTCPEQRWWPEQLRFSSDCPVHELERVSQ